MKKAKVIVLLVVVTIGFFIGCSANKDPYESFKEKYKKQYIPNLEYIEIPTEFGKLSQALLPDGTTLVIEENPQGVICYIK